MLESDISARYAYISQDEKDSNWHIEPRYDKLPLDIPITYEYMGDSFLPVAWGAMPAAAEKASLLEEVSSVMLDAKIRTPHYYAGDSGEVFRVSDDGYETLLCVVTTFGDAHDIAYAMNHTFPKTDTTAFHQERRANQAKRTDALIKSLQSTSE